ncbi:hypothetical protein ACPEIF_16675, partial [Streptomyces sp. NPDC012600]
MINTSVINTSVMNSRNAVCVIVHDKAAGTIAAVLYTARSWSLSCPEFRRVRWSCFRRTAGFAPGSARRLLRTR